VCAPMPRTQPSALGGPSEALSAESMARGRRRQRTLPQWRPPPLGRSPARCAPEASVGASRGPDFLVVWSASVSARHT